jgi:alpha-ketoglutarate-dependent taurine dioxygenase
MTQPSARSRDVLGENGMIYMPDQKLTLEAQPFLERLFAPVIRPAMIYRHNWNVRDVVMWDNYQPQNIAIGDDALPLRRLMRQRAVINTAALVPV